MFDYTYDERVLYTRWLNMKRYEEGPPFIPEIQFAAKGCVLAPFQTHIIAHALVNKKTLISADTGLGKTVIAAALINILSDKFYTSKWVMICPLFNMEQTKQKLSNLLYDKRIITLSNSKDDTFRATQLSMNDWDVVLVSYQSLVNPEVQNMLINNREVITGLITDESQLLANLDGSASNMLYSMCRHLEFVYLLTATPIRVNVGQFIKQMLMLDRNMFGINSTISKVVRTYTKTNQEGKPIGVKYLDALLEATELNYISYTRQDLGLKGNYFVEPIIVPNKYMYTDVSRKDIFSQIKGDPTGPALRMLVRVVKQKISEGKKGLIYINLNANKKLAYNALKASGVRVGILDGTITNNAAKKNKAKQEFLDGQYDCVITNLTVGLDLPCEYILFYELTFDFKQMLGRCERGLQANDTDVIFIIVANTEEVSYFYENVYLRAEMLGLVCQKDVSELKVAYRELKSLGMLS